VYLCAQNQVLLPLRRPRADEMAVSSTAADGVEGDDEARAPCGKRRRTAHRRPIPGSAALKRVDAEAFDHPEYGPIEARDTSRVASMRGLFEGKLRVDCADPRLSGPGGRRPSERPPSLLVRSTVGAAGV